MICHYLGLKKDGGIYLHGSTKPKQHDTTIRETSKKPLFIKKTQISCVGCHLLLTKKHWLHQRGGGGLVRLHQRGRGGGLVRLHQRGRGGGLVRLHQRGRGGGLVTRHLTAALPYTHPVHLQGTISIVS